MNTKANFTINNMNHFVDSDNAGQQHQTHCAVYIMKYQIDHGSNQTYSKTTQQGIHHQFKAIHICLYGQVINPIVLNTVSVSCMDSVSA
ncbi:hypothetical protein HA052_04405 [Chromobacterium haemolyticum]|uniref:Uncharacterized protein n=1 Tax=Chromobacterium fluminis TaxID=3044269 RepID=A0ABX0KY10_9NEIS|nr:hypothetical protein [Chromobacterium haemolyticum]NHR04432.1 hypothetical protein [Chromobacterium haemolyticum]